MNFSLEAAVLEELGSDLTIKQLFTEPLKKGQVLVKILYSGVCRSQLMEVRGLRGKDRWLPHLLGHEGSGIVESIGEGVEKVKPGDAVILTWIKGSGLEADGARYADKQGRRYNSGLVTTFSNYSVVSENRVLPKPIDVPFDAAILFGCALPTGAGIVFNEVCPGPSHSVIVVGLGGIGLSATLALSSLDIKQIIAVDVASDKLEMAKTLGAHHILDAKDPLISEKVAALTDGGADFCIESAGRTSTIELGFSFIKSNGGHLVFASHPPEGDTIRLAPHELISGKTIAGSWGGATNPDEDIPAMASKFLSSGAPLNSLITKRYKLEEINSALSDLERGAVFRPLIEMNH